MASVSSPLPRVTIQFCTQCKWMLRAAYFAQELLSTFGNALREVALQPSTGGTFIVSIYFSEASAESEVQAQIEHRILWDRKAEGGFPETKELKRRVRDVIEPGRDLGHVDRKETVGSPPRPVGAIQNNDNPPNIAERAKLDQQGQEAKEAIGEKAEGKAEEKAEDKAEGEEIHKSENISNVYFHEKETHSKSLAAEVGAERARMEQKKVDLKVQPDEDGSTCKDCN